MTTPDPAPDPTPEPLAPDSTSPPAASPPAASPPAASPPAASPPRPARSGRPSAKAVIGTVLGVLLILGLVVAEGSFVGDWRVDDALITFSFSKNLAAGHGPVYSHEVRVEGYSNFLWMVLLGLGGAFREQVDYYLIARVLAYLFFAAMGVGVYRLGRLRGGALTSLAAVALVACTTDMTTAALSGLETVPYAALLTLAMLAYVREPPAQRRWSLFWFLPVALMRIDGCVPLVFVVGFELISAFLERRLRVRSFLRWALPPLTIYGLYFLWRWHYYGLFLPTTYYAKSMVSAGNPERGTNYVWDALRASGLVAAFPFIALGLVRWPSRAGLLLASYVVTHALYVTQVGGDWMPFTRFLLPIVPLIAILFSWGLEEARDAVKKRPARVRALVALAGLMAWVFVVVRVDGHSVNSPFERDKQWDVEHTRNHTKNNLLKAAPLLPYITRAPGETMVSDYAGLFALYTDASIIDMWGLCNARIATEGTVVGIRAIYGKTCPKCYADWKPIYFHANVPLVRRGGAFTSHAEVVGTIFQHETIGSYLDLQGAYATGRVLRPSTDEAVFFIERRRPGVALVPRHPAPDILVDYPFEPQGH